jgi:hypothetical protein
MIGISIEGATPRIRQILISQYSFLVGTCLNSLAERRWIALSQI